MNGEGEKEITASRRRSCNSLLLFREKRGDQGREEEAGAKKEGGEEAEAEASARSSAFFIPRRPFFVFLDFFFFLNFLSGLFSNKLGELCSDVVMGNFFFFSNTYERQESRPLMTFNKICPNK